MPLVLVYYGEDFFGFFVFIGFLGFFFSHRYVSSHQWIHEPSEKKIFVNLYRSLGLVELYSEKKGKESRLYRDKAIKHVKKSITELYKMCRREETISILFNNEYASRLKRLAKNLQNRMLSRIVNGKDLVRIISTLRGLTKFFGEIQRPMRLDELDSINENLETFEEMPYKERVIRTMFKRALVSKPSQFIFSIVFGYIAISIIIWIFCQFLTLNFVEFMQSNLVSVISGGALISGVIASIFVLKK